MKILIEHRREKPERPHGIIPIFWDAYVSMMQRIEDRPALFPMICDDTILAMIDEARVLSAQAYGFDTGDEWPSNMDDLEFILSESEVCLDCLECDLVQYNHSACGFCSLTPPIFLDEYADFSEYVMNDLMGLLNICYIKSDTVGKGFMGQEIFILMESPQVNLFSDEPNYEVVANGGVIIDESTIKKVYERSGLDYDDSITLF